MAHVAAPVVAQVEGLAESAGVKEALAELVFLLVGSSDAVVVLAGGVNDRREALRDSVPNEPVWHQHASGSLDGTAGEDVQVGLQVGPNDLGRQTSQFAAHVVQERVEEIHGFDRDSEVWVQTIQRPPECLAIRDPQALLSLLHGYYLNLLGPGLDCYNPWHSTTCRGGGDCMIVSAQPPSF